MSCDVAGIICARNKAFDLVSSYIIAFQPAPINVLAFAHYPLKETVHLPNM